MPPGELQAPVERRPLSPLRALAAGGAISTVGVTATAVFGLIRVKGLAVTLGPVGVGEYGQIWVFVLYGGSIAAVGIGVGMTRFVAAERERNDAAALSALASTALAVPLFVGTALGLLTIGASVALAQVLLGSNATSLVWLAALSIPLVGLHASFQGLVQGFEDARGQALISALYGACFAVLSITGAALFDVTGAVVALLLGNVVLAALYLQRAQALLASVGGGLRSVRRRMLHFVRPLLAIGSGALLGLAVFSISDLAVRASVLHYSGKENLGLWVALSTVSLQFLGAVSSGVVFITAPLTARVAVREDDAAVSGVIDDSLRLSLCTMAPLIGLIIVLRDPFVSLLFSDEFEGVTTYLPLEMAGDFLRACAWPLGLCLVPLGFVRVWVTTGVMASSMYGLSGVYLTSQHGLFGAVAAYVLLWATLLAAIALWLVARGVWRPTRRSALGFLVGAVMLAAVTVTPTAIGLAVVVVATGLLVLASTTSGERSAMARLVTRRPE